MHVHEPYSCQLLHLLLNRFVIFVFALLSFFVSVDAGHNLLVVVYRHESRHDVAVVAFSSLPESLDDAFFADIL